MVTRCDYNGCFEKADYGFYISAKSKPDADYETAFEGDFCKKHFNQLTKVTNQAIGRVKV